MKFYEEAGKKFRKERIGSRAKPVFEGVVDPTTVKVHIHDARRVLYTIFLSGDSAQNKLERYHAAIQNFRKTYDPNNYEIALHKTDALTRAEARLIRDGIAALLVNYEPQFQHLRDEASARVIY